MDDAGDVQPPLCDLCEEGQEAKYTCPTCMTYFCSRCRRTHDKLCKSSLVSEVRATSGQGDQSKREPGKRAQEVEIQMMEDVLRRLAEEEKRLGQERRTREHDILVRYATLLRHAAEARDASLVSLRDVSQVLGDALQADVTLARDILNRLKQETTGRGMTSQSPASSGDVLTEANRRHFEELVQKKEGEDLLRLHPSERFTEAVLRSHRDFMGTVVTAEQIWNKPVDTDPAHPTGSDDRQAQSPGGSTPGTQAATQEEHADPPQEVDIKGLASKLERTERLVTMLQNQNTLLCRDLASLHDKNTTLCADVTLLQTKVTSLGDAGNKVCDDLMSLQRDHVGVRDKNSLLCQDIQQLRSDLNTVQKDRDKLLTDVSTLQIGQNELKTNQSKFQTDQSKLQTDQNDLQSDQNKLQSDLNKLKADQNKLQTDQNKLQTDHEELQIELNKVNKELGTLKKAVGDKNSSELEKDLLSLQDSLKEDSTAIAMLETVMSKYDTYVIML